MFLGLFILNIGTHIIIGYIPHLPINGVVLIFLIAWSVVISVIAAVLQIITAVAVWLFKRQKDKKHNNDIN